MHTQQYEIEGYNKPWPIRRNGDFSGGVTFDVDPMYVVEEGYVGDGEYLNTHHYEVELPFELIRNIVLDYYRNQAVKNWEEADHETLDEWMAGCTPESPDAMRISYAAQASQYLTKNERHGHR